MEVKVRNELDTLLRMVTAWRDDKIRMAGGEDGWDFLVGDLAGEIEEHVYPYVRRMCECKYITAEEQGGFLDQCFAHVRLLAEHLQPVAEET